MDSDNDGLSDIDDDCPNQPELINGLKMKMVVRKRIPMVMVFLTK